MITKFRQRPDSASTWTKMIQYKHIQRKWTALTNGSRQHEGFQSYPVHIYHNSRTCINTGQIQAYQTTFHMIMGTKLMLSYPLQYKLIQLMYKVQEVKFVGLMVNPRLDEVKIIVIGKTSCRKAVQGGTYFLL